jgi:hypothetical protein
MTSNTDSSEPFPFTWEVTETEDETWVVSTRRGGYLDDQRIGFDSLEDAQRWAESQADA